MATQKILHRDFILTFFAQLAFSSVYYIFIPTLPIYLSKWDVSVPFKYVVIYEREKVLYGHWGETCLIPLLHSVY